MLTKLTLKKLEKLNTYVEPMDDEKQEKLYDKMWSLISRSASNHEFDEIQKAQDRDTNNGTSNMDNARDDLHMNALDVYERYNANPTIKSMCRNTKKSAKLRLAFFFGNEIGITKEQNKAYEQGTQDFGLYMGSGYSQADDDADYIDLIKKGKLTQTPNPADLLDDADKIMKNIKIGKDALKHPEDYQKDLKQLHLNDKAVANMAI